MVIFSYRPFKNLILFYFLQHFKHSCFKDAFSLLNYAQCANSSIYVSILDGIFPVPISSAGLVTPGFIQVVHVHWAVYMRPEAWVPLAEIVSAHPLVAEAYDWFQYLLFLGAYWLQVLLTTLSLFPFCFSTWEISLPWLWAQICCLKWFSCILLIPYFLLRPVSFHSRTLLLLNFCFCLHFPLFKWTVYCI